MTTDPKDHTVGHDLARVATPDEKHSINEKSNKGLTSPSDDFIVNSEGVTHEELRTLRSVPDRLPFTAWLVIVVECAERYVESIKVRGHGMCEYARSSPLTLSFVFRWSYYGTANIFNNYIRAPLPPGSTTGAVDAAHRGIGVAGALGKGQEISFAIRMSATLLDTLRHTNTTQQTIVRHFQHFLGLCHSHYGRVRVCMILRS